ncbi:MAG: WG repeat-containing protein [Lewinellaceae bacterium]|nr:WG repeat-containing protein [Lewinellaceae bacterium]
MTRFLPLALLLIPTLFFAQKFELPWEVKPILEGFDEFSAGWGGDQFIVAKKDSRYGLLTYKGKQILNFEYDRISADWAGVIFAKKGNTEFWFDKNGKSFGENIENVVPLHDHRYAVQKNGRWGLFDSKLNVITPIECSLDESPEKDLILVHGSERINLGPFLAPDGSRANVLKAINMDRIWPGVTLYKDPNTTKRGIMGPDGNPISPAIYTIGFGHPNGYAVVSTDNKKWGITTKDHNITVDFIYDRIGNINDQLSAPVELNGQSGVIDVSTGAILIEPGLYDKILTSNKVYDFYVVEKNGLQGICDARGKVLAPPVYDKALKSGPYLYVIQQLHSDFPLRGLLNLDGKEVFKPDSVKLWVFDNGTLFIERPDESTEHLDISGRVLQAFERWTTTLFENNWIIEEVDGVVRFYHSNSTPEKQIWMDDVTDSEDGLHRVRQGNLFGYMLNSGKILVPPVLESASMPDDKYLYVQYKKKWGVLKNTYY